MSSPFSFFQNESCGSDLSVASEEIREEIALRQMAHTYLALVLFACCFHHEKFFPWDLVKMVSPMYFATREMYLFFWPFFCTPERNLSLPIFVSAGFITLHEFVNFYREDTLEG